MARLCVRVIVEPELTADVCREIVKALAPTLARGGGELEFVTRDPCDCGETCAAYHLRRHNQTLVCSWVTPETPQEVVGTANVPKTRPNASKRAGAKVGRNLAARQKREGTPV